MLIIQFLIIFIIGFVFGYFTFSIISSKNKSSKDLKEELRVVKHEMEQYKQDVADHFSCTTKLSFILGSLLPDSSNKNG